MLFNKYILSISIMVIIINPIHNDLFSNKIHINNLNKEKLVVPERKGTTLPIFIDNDTFIIGTISGIKYMDIDLNNIWSYSNSNLSVEHISIISDNRIIFSNTDGGIYCIDIKGNLQWRKEFGLNVLTELLIYGEDIVFGYQSSDFKEVVICINSNGDLIWEKEVYYIDGLYKYDKYSFILCEGSDKSIIKNIKINGTISWTARLSHRVEGIPGFYYESMVVFTDNKKLFVFNVSNGKLINQYNTPFNVEGKIRFLRKDIIIFQDYNGFIVCYNITKNNELWSVKVGINYSPDFTIINKTIYYASTIINTKERDRSIGFIYKINNDGSIIDSYEIYSENNPYIHGKVVIDDYNNIYILGVKDTLIQISSEKDYLFVIICTSILSLILLIIIISIVITEILMGNKV